ncbi:hypothetical protein L6164_029713 [Bauhinia variegata]|uniref:Uncharacterized protein n=1 Tax=Bauhinia variegata TaxID=167791 RepID=A0ACB9LAI1_BAUVA|nr:hypothetical protein L6164_029713 [Bauhinia variegata]
MARCNGSSDGRGCAACNYHRKSCEEDCILAAYFPLEKAKGYEAVNQLHGFSILSEKLKKFDSESDRKEFVKSVIWDALNVDGCGPTLT